MRKEVYMKKYWSKVFVLSLIVLLFVLVLGAAEQPESTYTINTPYEYPILPGTQEWLDLGTVFNRRRACQIPEDILHEMTTDALLQTVLDYPFLGDMYAFNTIKIGYETVKGRFNGLQEFENRSDHLDALLRYCTESFLLEDDEKSSQDYMAEKIYFVLSDALNSSTSPYASWQYAYTKTPAGNDITLVEGRTYGVQCYPLGGDVFTQKEIQDRIEEDKLEYPTATLLRGASDSNLPAYNCLSYALYSQSSNNDCWLQGVDKPTGPWTYFSDGSYVENTGRPVVGQLLVYGYNADVPNLGPTHIGIINTLYRGEVISKWGAGGLWLHQWMDCPYAEETGYHSTVYELNPNLAS